MTENKKQEVENQVIEAKQNPNFVKFAKSIEYEGKTYDGLNLNLSALTGEDIEKAEVEFVSLNPSIAAQTPLKEMSKGFQALLAAKAAGVNPGLIRALPAAEYGKFTQKVQVFLLTQD